MYNAETYKLEDKDTTLFQPSPTTEHRPFFYKSSLYLYLTHIYIFI